MNGRAFWIWMSVWCVIFLYIFGIGFVCSSILTFGFFRTHVLDGNLLNIYYDSLDFLY